MSSVDLRSIDLKPLFQHVSGLVQYLTECERVRTTCITPKAGRDAFRGHLAQTMFHALYAEEELIRLNLGPHLGPDVRNVIAKHGQLEAVVSLREWLLEMRDGNENEWAKPVRWASRLPTDAKLIPDLSHELKALDSILTSLKAVAETEENQTANLPPNEPNNTEGEKPAGRGGRPPLSASRNPVAKVKLNLYELVRVAKEANPSWGKKELQTHFKDRKDFRQCMKNADLSFNQQFFHTALEWIRKNPKAGQETRSDNIS